MKKYLYLSLMLLACMPNITMTTGDEEYKKLSHANGTAKSRNAQLKQELQDAMTAHNIQDSEHSDLQWKRHNQLYKSLSIGEGNICCCMSALVLAGITAHNWLALQTPDKTA